MFAFTWSRPYPTRPRLNQGMFYAYDNFTGNSVSLKTRVRAEAEQKVNAMNETERQT